MKIKIMLYTYSPIGKIQIPAWQEQELIPLTNEQLLQRALHENKTFVISPAVYAMVEKRQLGRVLQYLINPNVGLRHDIAHAFIFL